MPFFSVCMLHSYCTHQIIRRPKRWNCFSCWYSASLVCRLNNDENGDKTAVELPSEKDGSRRTRHNATKTKIQCWCKREGTCCTVTLPVRHIPDYFRGILHSYFLSVCLKYQWNLLESCVLSSLICTFIIRSCLFFFVVIINPQSY